MDHHNRLRYSIYNKLLVGLLAISSPALAENDNVSNPVAAATGNVTNSAIQFNNNGNASRQQFDTGVSCNGSTLSFSPFYMGNDTESGIEDGYVINENWGFQLSWSIPLNRDLTEQCLDIAKQIEAKNSLDYELVRALKCAELQRLGFTFLPGSRVYHVCSDVVPIQSLLPEK